MNDYNKLIDALAKYGSRVSSQFFGLTGAPIEALLKIGLNNLIENKYSIIRDMMFDKEGNMSNIEDFWCALEEVMRERPVEFMGLKFNDKDIVELKKIF